MINAKRRRIEIESNMYSFQYGVLQIFNSAEYHQKKLNISINCISKLCAYTLQLWVLKNISFIFSLFFLKLFSLKSNRINNFKQILCVQLNCLGRI